MKHIKERVKKDHEGAKRTREKVGRKLDGEQRLSEGGERVGEMRRWERMTIRRKKKCQRENVSVTYLKVIRSSEKETNIKMQGHPF